eukprot:m.207080 g.207080  ORF g.207080 m.207080 type:complete len:509 (-) comp18914_c0_seq1:107-1633(-)
MAPSKGKKQVVLQHELNTTAAFDKFLAGDGLKVVDAYSEWCGPCTALQGTFKRIKTEIGDPLLSFAVAKTDAIDSLEKYRKKSKPTFLFYGKDVLVNVIRGADSPKIESAIKQLLEAEHNIIDSGGERQEFKDAELVAKGSESEETAEDAGGTDEPAAPKKSYTLLLIKPETSSVEGEVDEIFAAVAEAGFHVAAQEDVEIDADKAKIVFADEEGNEGYDDLVATCTGGSCKALVLSSADADGDCAVLFARLFDEPAENPDAETADDVKSNAEEADDVTTEEDLAGAAATVSVLAIKHAKNVFYSASTSSARTQISVLLEDFAKDVLAAADEDASAGSTDGEKTSDTTAEGEDTAGEGGDDGGTTSDAPSEQAGPSSSDDAQAENGTTAAPAETQGTEEAQPSGADPPAEAASEEAAQGAAVEHADDGTTGEAQETADEGTPGDAPPDTKEGTAEAQDEPAAADVENADASPDATPAAEASGEGQGEGAETVVPPTDAPKEGETETTA